MKTLVTASQSVKISENASGKLLAKMAELFGSMREVKGIVGSFRCEMEGECQENPSAKMADGFRIEGIQRKKDSDDLEGKTTKGFEIESAKMEAGVKNEENARVIVQEEIAVMKKEIRNIKMVSCCIACSAASVGVGLGPGMHVPPTPWTTR